MGGNDKIELRSPLWGKQRDETHRQWMSFCIYRDLGKGRSLEKALKEANKKRTTKAAWGEWSKKNQWVKRSEAYDDYLEGKVRESNETEIVKMNKRHVKSMVYIQNKIFVNTIMALKDTDYKKLRLSDAISILEKTIKLERMGRGVSTEITDHNITTSDKMEKLGLIEEALKIRKEQNGNITGPQNKDPK